MILVLLIYAIARYREELFRNQRLESAMLLFIVGVVYLYAVQIYGSINPWLGGGAPMSATFFLAAPAPGSDSRIVEGRLIEETSHGYYLLSDADPKRPLFLPREGVVGIRFADAGALTDDSGRRP